MMLLIVAAVTAMQSAPAAPPKGTPTDQQFAHARSALDERLFDYPTARFRQVRADGTRVCGYVNAKNRFGAYSGWKLFGVLGDDGELVWIDDTFMLEVICTADLMATPDDYTERMTPGRAAD